MCVDKDQIFKQHGRHHCRIQSVVEDVCEPLTSFLIDCRVQQIVEHEKQKRQEVKAFDKADFLLLQTVNLDREKNKVGDGDE